MIRGSFFTTYNQHKIIRLICTCWFISKAICYKLWLTDRLFPLIPVNAMLEYIPPSIHTLLLVGSAISMLLLIISPGRKIAMLLLLLELFSCMLDQNRWQPWEYQFVFMLAAYIFNKQEKDVRLSWQLIIAGLFFFSGINKLNSAFIHDIWQNLFLHRWLGVGHVNIWASRIGYALPLIETMAGIGLLINRVRKPAIWILIIMHGIILLMLGPVGLNMNVVIWPWNVLMPLLLLVIFYQEAFRFQLSFFKKPFSWFILTCWWTLPWLQLAGYWDKYLSSVLYSGGVEQLFICTNDKLAKKEMAEYSRDQFRIIPCSPVLSVYEWGIKEMNTAPYPEPRIYKAIIQIWQNRYPDNTDKFYIYKPGFSPTAKEYKLQDNR